MKRSLLVAALLAIPASAHAEDATTPAPAARESDPHRWGDASVNVVERFGFFQVPTPEVGKSGLLQGAGVELRFVMPAEWGAYYRYVTSATKNDDQFEWSHREFMAGFSRRLLHVGRSDLWSPRAAAHVDVGVGYASIGTNGSCSSRLTPFGLSCVTDAARSGLNASGDAIALEARVGGDVSYGILFLGVDVGIAGFLRITTGPNSVSPPSLMYLPSGQLRLGLGFPFS